MKRLPIIFVVLSLPLYLLDQVTKWWVVFRFREPLSNDFHTPDEHVAVIDGFLWWWRIHNQGAAFGLGNGTSWAPFVFLLVLIFALVLIFVFWRKGAFANRSARLAAALLVAGVLGNLTDRLLQGFWLEKHTEKSFVTRLSKGYVVDFIRVKLPGYEKIAPVSRGFFPTFNVADSCISVAAVLLFLSAFRPEESKKETEGLSGS
ncbi:signal peptidase II [bacterium]|nr:signal peptidase II [Akkermansiaceae bacterium]MDB4405505.1 signal peptidase II [bacterium]MDB4478248.1 signal peptidase II [Akkermansiaceae bacterium]MDB4483424.1 signal peptidase II [Akkermansiaceae bacterium]